MLDMFDPPRHVTPRPGPRRRFAGVTHDPAAGPASHTAIAIEATRSALVRIVLSVDDGDIPARSGIPPRPTRFAPSSGVPHARAPAPVQIDAA